DLELEVEPASGNGAKTSRPPWIQHEVGRRLKTKSGVRMPMQLLAHATNGTRRHLSVKNVADAGVSEVGKRDNGVDEIVSSSLGGGPFRLPHLVTRRDIDLDIDGLSNAAGLRIG